MASIQDVIGGLVIIRKYSTHEEYVKNTIRAEHDQIWCEKDSYEEMTPSELKSMEEYGWFEDAGDWSKLIEK